MENAVHIESIALPNLEEVVVHFSDKTALTVSASELREKFADRLKQNETPFSDGPGL